MPVNPELTSNDALLLLLSDMRIQIAKDDDAISALVTRIAELEQQLAEREGTSDATSTEATS